MMKLLIKAWETFLDVLYRIGVLITFLSILPLIGFIAYHFYYYDWHRIIVGSIVLLVSIHANLKMKGGK